MSLTIIILFLLSLASSLFIAFQNPFSVTFKLTEALSFNIPFVILVMTSFFSGALVLYIIYLVLSSKNIIREWKILLKKKKGENIEKMFSQGKSFLLRGKKSDAFFLLKRILKKDPKHVNTLNILGDIYRDKGKYSKAIKHHSRAYQLNRDNIHVLYSLASDYEKTGDLKEAMAAYKDIRMIDKESTKPLYHIRNIYVKNLEWDKACEIQNDIIRFVRSYDYESVPKEKRVLSKIYFEKAIVFKKKDDETSAKKELKRAIKTDPKYAPPFLLFSEFYLKEDNIKAAEDILLEGYNNNNTSTIILKKLEEIYLKDNKEEKVITLYKNALSSNSNNAGLNLTFAEAYFNMGMLNESLEELKNVDSADSNKLLIHKIKGAIFEKRDDMRSAVREYKNILHSNSLNKLFSTCKSCGYYIKNWNIECDECKIFFQNP